MPRLAIALLLAILATPLPAGTQPAGKVYEVRASSGRLDALPELAASPGTLPVEQPTRFE